MRRYFPIKYNNARGSKSLPQMVVGATVTQTQLEDQAAVRGSHACNLVNTRTLRLHTQDKGIQAGHGQIAVVSQLAKALLAQLSVMLCVSRAAAKIVT